MPEIEMSIIPTFKDFVPFWEYLKNINRSLSVDYILARLSILYKTQ